MVFLEHDWIIFPWLLGISSSQLTNIFQRGWNHQPGQVEFCGTVWILDVTWCHRKLGQGHTFEAQTIPQNLHTWWIIPLSKWLISPVINGISRVNPLMTRDITYLLSGMIHQVFIILRLRPASQEALTQSALRRSHLACKSIGRLVATSG